MLAIRIPGVIRGIPEVSTWEDPTHCTKLDPELGLGGSGFHTVRVNWGQGLRHEVQTRPERG